MNAATDKKPTPALDNKATSVSLRQAVKALDAERTELVMNTIENIKPGKPLDLSIACEGYFNALFVIPANVKINCLDELLKGGCLPVPRIKQLCLQLSEEALTGSIVGGVSFTRYRKNQLCVVYPRRPPRPAIVGITIILNDGLGFAVG